MSKPSEPCCFGHLSVFLDGIHKGSKMFLHGLVKKGFKVRSLVQMPSADGGNCSAGALSCSGSPTHVSLKLIPEPREKASSSLRALCKTLP